jgi:hypothetical protein
VDAKDAWEFAKSPAQKFTRVKTPLLTARIVSPKPQDVWCHAIPYVDLFSIRTSYVI